MPRTFYSNHGYTMRTAQSKTTTSGASMEAEPDLMGIGQHCSVEHCQQRDFLPFTCDSCQEPFCLEHRTYQAHKCLKAGSKVSTTIVCPLCAKAIKLAEKEDANRAFEEHQRTDCDPANYARVYKKRRCPVPDCKEKLTTVNCYSCKGCGTQVCLKHRFPRDHNCSTLQQEQRAAAAAAWQPNLMQGMRSLFLAATPGQRSAANSAKSPSPIRPQPPPAPQPRSVTPATAAAAARQHPSSAAPSQRHIGAGSATAEYCTQCGAGFATVQELIFHAEAFHPSGNSGDFRASGSGTGGGWERCPHCAQAFPDPVTLVEHVERQHANKSACVLS